MDKNKKAEYLINKWSKQHSLNSRELTAIWDRSKELTSKKTRKAVNSFNDDEWQDALNFFRTMVGEEFNIPLTKLTEKIKMSEDKTTKLKLNKSYILEDVVVKANTSLVVLNEASYSRDDYAYIQDLAKKHRHTWSEGDYFMFAYSKIPPEIVQNKAYQEEGVFYHTGERNGKPFLYQVSEVLSGGNDLKARGHGEFSSYLAQYVPTKEIDSNNYQIWKNK